MTLGEVTSLLSRYIGSGNNATDRINLVRDRYLRAGNFLGTKEVVTFQVYPDVNGNGFITLPRRYAGIIGATQDGSCSGYPLNIRNAWYEFAHGGAGRLNASTLPRGVVPIEGRFTTFQDWNVPLYLRVKLEQSETSSKIIVRGSVGGQEIFTLDGGNWIRGVVIPINALTTATTTQAFDLPPYSIIKPITKGRVFLYTVDANGVESEVGVYEPNETLPKYRRYKVPISPTTVPTVQAVPIPAVQIYTKADIDAMFTDAGTITVSAAGTTDLTAASPYALRTVKIIAQAGVGAYVYNFTLNRTPAKTGALFRARLEIAASANPTINFYDSSTSGTLLKVIAGDSSNAYFATAVFEYDGSAWHWTGFEQ